MSLCGIWRDPSDKLYLFSDSRISTEESHSDTGVKIISVPVKITDPGNADELIYSSNIALCFAGECLPAYFLVLTLSQLLQSLEIDPLHGSMSFDAITELIRKAYQEAATEQFNNSFIKQSDLPDIIIAGWCPERNRLRAKKLFADEDSIEIVIKVVDVVQQERTIHFIGSGAKFAKKIYDARGGDCPLQLVDWVSRVEKTVGGPVQYGAFKEQSFFLCGTVRSLVNNCNQFTYLGLTLYGDSPTFYGTGFYFKQSFIALDAILNYRCAVE